MRVSRRERFPDVARVDTRLRPQETLPCHRPDRIARHRLRRDHLDHQPDDMAWRAELPVLTGGRDLREHVLVQVALGVALLHRHLVDHIDDLRQQSRRGNRETRVFHVMRVGRLVAAQCSKERKHMLANQLYMSAGGKCLKRDQR